VNYPFKLFSQHAHTYTIRPSVHYNATSHYFSKYFSESGAQRGD